MDYQTLAQQIGLVVYKAIDTVYRRQPMLLAEPYRAVDWNADRSKAIWMPRLVRELSKAIDRHQLIRRAERILRTFFVPRFFRTPFYQSLSNTIQQMVDRQTAAKPSRPVLSPAHSIEPIALLLLDAENIRLNLIDERQLQQYCRYPIQIKIAFANWRSIGKQDAEFHERGYQMIHVPSGKNLADMQMTAIGSSLFLQYPNTREAVVCSSDGHLLPLCNLLQTQGLIVHAVRKHFYQLTLTHHATGDSEVLLNIMPASPKAELEQKLIQLLQELTAETATDYVPISTLSQLYKQRYSKSITDNLKAWNLGNQFLKFLKTCQSLTLSHTPEGWQVALVEESDKLAE